MIKYIIYFILNNYLSNLLIIHKFLRDFYLFLQYIFLNRKTKMLIRVYIK